MKVVGRTRGARVRHVASRSIPGSREVTLFASLARAQQQPEADCRQKRSHILRRGKPEDRAAHQTRVGEVGRPKKVKKEARYQKANRKYPHQRSKRRMPPRNPKENGGQDRQKKKVVETEVGARAARKDDRQ